MVPSIGLLSQTISEWTFARKQEFKILCICSDQTVGKNEDSFMHDRKDFCFPIKSENDDISLF